MEKVNWRKQYRLDNIFNIVILVMSLLSVLLGYKDASLILIGIGLFVNFAASRFFDKKKFE